MDVLDLITLLRDRLRSGDRGDIGGHAGISGTTAADQTDADGRPGGAAGDEPAPPGRDARQARRGVLCPPAAGSGDRALDLVVIDGGLPFAQVLRTVADAEHRSRPGDVLAIVGADPAPGRGDDGADTGGALVDAWRIAGCLRRHRPDLALWVLPPTDVPPGGLLVVGALDPGNRTLDRAFDRIVAEMRADPEGSDPWHAATTGDPAFTTVDALLAALPDHRVGEPAAPMAKPVDPAATPVAEPGWRRAEQRCIRAYYEGQRAEGLLACDTVLSSPGVPQAVRTQTLRNQTFYAPTLASLVRRFDHRRIDLPLSPGWFPTNPSIAADGDGYLAIVRTLDYEIVGPHRYRFNDPAGLPHTVNVLLRLDRELRTIAAYPAVDATLLEPRHPCHFAGLEDCRLVNWQGNWVASCGTVDRTPTCVGKIDLVRLDPATGAFHSAVPLSGRAAMRWEKNWMPVVAGGDLLFVYGCDPVSVLRFDPDVRAVVPHRQHAAPPIARELKGGSQGVPVPAGWLFCVHQSADFPDRNRCYLHRFMLLDDDFRMTHLSHPFTFLAPGIEFCAGLALRGDDLVASFGVEDREAHLVRTSLPDVLALLEPVGGES